MKLYNKGARGFIIKREDAISGCRLPGDEIGKTRAYIDPGKTAEVTDSCGADLIRKYPNELIAMDNGEGTRQEKLEKAHKEIEADKVEKKAKAKTVVVKSKAKPKAKAVTKKPVAKKKATKKR